MWFRANQVTATSGSKIVVVNSGEDVGVVSANDGLIVGTFLPVEIKSAYANANGDQIIELLYEWSDSTQTTVPAKVIPTAGDFVAATAALRNATENTRDNYKTMDDWGSLDADTDIGYGKGIVEFTGADNVKHQARSMQKMDEDVDEAIDELIGTKDSVFAMTKADFFALAEKRIRDNAGSGNAEWGHSSNGFSSGRVDVNNGITCADSASSGWVDKFSIGYTGNDDVSRSVSPLVNVNGIQHTMSLVNESVITVAAGTRINGIQFPPAPDGTKSYDSATGIVTQHASAAEAFEGIMFNGNMRNGVSNWRAVVAPSTLTASNGVLTLDTNTNAGNIYIRHDSHPSAEVGKQYVLEFEITDCSDFSRLGYASCLGVPLGDVKQLGKHSRLITAVDTDEFQLGCYGSSFDWVLSIKNVSLLPVTEKVITSRQDYVFMESWHEKISDKDVVYPLGNVQYGASSYEGISLLTRDDGYTRFGEWDDNTTGNYAVWDDLSFAEKDVFLSDPNNNIYKDGDDLIQVRYRVRVVEGLGDEWAKVDADVKAPWMGYSDSKRVRVQGMLTSNASFSPSASVAYNGTDNATYHPDIDAIGAYGNNGSGFSHNGLCFAIPIALVQRRNQGAFSPEFNPNGCAAFTASNGNTISRSWQHENVIGSGKVTSALSCFNFGNTAGDAASFTGFIGSITTNAQAGRSDEKFFNAIYASDVEDLRMSSRRVPVAEIREQYKRKAIAGEIRGFEGVPFTLSVDVGVVSNSQITGGRILVYTDAGDIFGGRATDGYVDLVGAYLINKADNSLRKVINVQYSTASDNISIRLEGDDPWSFDSYFIGGFPQTHKQANPTWTDIIGDPANIADTFPNGVEGQWIAQVPDGTYQYKDFPLNRKCMEDTITNSPATSNNGDTWVAGSSGADVNLNRFNSTGVVAPSTIRLISYETQAHFTEDDVNSVVLDLGGVFATSDSNATQENQYRGVILHSSLTGNVGTVGGYIKGAINNKTLTSYGSFESNKLSGTRVNYAPTHTTIDLDGGSSNAAVKTLDYLSEDNGVGKLCYAYKEMVYDGGAYKNQDFIFVDGDTAYPFVAGTIYNIGSTSGRVAWHCDITVTIAFSLLYIKGDGAFNSSGSQWFTLWNGNGWGDDNQFQIADNQESFTDDNGNTGLRGTASFKTQYFIDKSN